MDARNNCLANYDEYLLMRDIDRQKQQTLSNHLKDQISYKRSTLIASRQANSIDEAPYSEFKNTPIALA